MPLVPLASSGGRGRFNQRSQPATSSRRYRGHSPRGTRRPATPAAPLSWKLLHRSFGAIILRVGFPGQQDLHRTVTGEQTQRTVRIQAEEVDPLVGRHPTGEADGQDLRVEPMPSCLGVADGFPAPETNRASARTAYVVDELAAGLAPGHPQEVVGSVADRCPRCGIVGPLRASPPQVLVEEFAKGWRQPRSDVHAIRHVRDGNVVDGSIRPAALPQRPCHLTVAAAHPVDRSAGAQRQRRQSQRRAGSLGSARAMATIRSRSPVRSAMRPRTFRKSQSSYVSFPAAIGVCVVNTSDERTLASLVRVDASFSC